MDDFTPEELDSLPERFRLARFDTGPLSNEADLELPRRIDAISAALADRIGHSEARLRPSSHIRHPRQSTFSLSRVAGVAIAAVVGIAAVVVSKMAVSPSRAVGHTVHHYHTQSAERATVRLPDGSRVTLAPGTSLSYTGDIATASTITLDGEAFFTVHHDPRRIFAVQSGHVVTRVLGTAFNIRKYAADSSADIAVLEGKVTSENARGSVTVTPGDVVSLTDSSIIRDARRPVGDAVAWTQGRLVFRSVPVAVVLQNLGRWSGYTFQLADSALNQKVITADLDVHNVSETLNVLATLLDVVMRVDDKVITMRPRKP